MFAQFANIKNDLPLPFWILIESTMMFLVGRYGFNYVKRWKNSSRPIRRETRRIHAQLNILFRR